MKKKSRKKKPKKKPGIAVVDVQSMVSSIAAAEQPEIPEQQKNFVTLEEAREDDEKFHIWRQQTFDWLQAEAAKLEALLLQYNSFDLIGNLTLTQLFLNPDKDTVAGHHGLPAIVEYATLLYLKHPFNVGLMKPIGQVPLEEIDEAGRAIHFTTGLYYGTDRRSTLVGEERDTLDSLRYRAMTHELSVRSPGYEHHQRETLTGLFDPFAEWMIENLGFQVTDVFAVEDAIQAITSRKTFARFKEGREAVKKLTSEVRAARRGEAPASDLSEMVVELSKLPPSKASAQIKAMMMGWVMTFIGSTCLVFDANEIAAETHLPIDRVVAVLAFFAIEFESVPSDFFLMSPTHPLREHPLVYHDGQFVYPVRGSMIWALQDRVEAEMNKSTPSASKAWRKYEKHRSDYLEAESVRLLSVALRTEKVYRNLTYSIVENGEEKTPELDGMIQFDHTLLLVESKAGALTASARRGGRERIKSNIGQLLGKAHKQALRARDYIDNADEPKFFSSDGSEIPFDKNRFTRIFLVSTTLEPLDIYNAALHEVVGAGLIEEKHLPWAVSLDNLRVIAEMNEFPTQLIHYLTRRLRINEFKKFYAGDELDWFGLYLSRGLYFDKDERFNEATQVMFDGSFSSAFDDYYFYKEGQRTKPARKPVQQMPKLLRRIILELDAHKESDGHSEAIIRLLNWDDEGREQLVKGIGEIRKRVRTKHRIHDFTMATTEDKAGVTFFATISSKSAEAMRKLRSYCLMKKYQIQADSWVGFLTIVEEQPTIQGFVVIHNPWTYDETMEALVAGLPSSQQLRIE
jgi:hypothetical protein